MPINSLIPLQAKGPDPDGFTNAFLQGMKISAFQNEADAAAREEEAAAEGQNALRGYYARGGKTTPEEINRLGAVNPAAAAAILKADTERRKGEADIGKGQAETLNKHYDLVSKALGAARNNPTRENVTSTLDYLDANDIPTADFRQKLASTPDQAIPGLIQARVLSFEKETGLRIQQANSESMAADRDARRLETAGYHDASLAGQEATRAATESRFVRTQNKPQFITNDAGTFAVTPQNPGQAVPVAGIPASGPATVVREADKAWLKGQDEAGTAAEKLSGTIQQANDLIGSEAGVLGSGPVDRAAYRLHQIGLNNSDAAVNTERLRELGAQMTLSFGSLGAQVSNADREVYARAQGNFENAKSPEAMRLSLGEMGKIAQATVEKVNRNRAAYQQTGQKPDFAVATPHPDSAPRPGVPQPLSPETEARKKLAMDKLRLRGAIE